MSSVLQQAVFAFVLCGAVGFAIGRFWAVLIPWAALAGWSAYNLATASPSADDPDLFAGLFVLAMLAALAATGVILGVALRRAVETLTPGSGDAAQGRV